MLQFLDEFANDRGFARSLMNGIILIDKPTGWTSFDVVAKIRGLLNHAQGLELKVPSQAFLAHSSPLTAVSRKVKVGHTGTLDPLATGLLILVLGDYCKRAEEFSKLDKTYEVTMTLGQTSTTGDGEGVKTAVSSKQVPVSELQTVLQQFTGEILQTPPIYSAVKINGQRAYKLARAGLEVKLEPRKVTVYSIELTDYNYPEVKFIASVSSGTYIRSLVEDIGSQLSTGAYMSGLRRTRVGKWNLTSAIAIPDISAETIAEHLITL